MKMILLISFSFFLLLNRVARAQTEEPPATVDLSLKVGASLAYYRYVEPTLISQTGFLIGAWLNWDYHLLFYRGVLQAEIHNGELNYDGAICQIKTNQCSDYKAKTTDLIFKLAHRFTYDFNDTFSAFAGLGYRFLYDKGEGSGFYRRTGQYLYVPVGFSTRLEMNSWPGVLIFEAEYDYFLNGAIESKLSDVNSAYSDVNHKQNKGYAVRLTLSFEAQKKPDDLRAWNYGVYTERWSIAKSDRAELLENGVSSGTFFYEPENFSETLGLKVGFSY